MYSLIRILSDKKIQPALTVLFVFFIVAGEMAAAAEKKDSIANIYGILRLPKQEMQLFLGFDNTTLQKATAMLVQEKDGKPDTTYVVCDENKFSFTRLRPGRIYLKISHLSYDTEEGIYDIAPGDNVIYFTMKEKVREIEESKVTAEVPLMETKGDTTIFNAAAVPTEEWDSALEIINRLPGFKVSARSITVDGRPVARTYVNGVQIFGDDPLSAFGALYAKEVTQVRVYDQQTAEDRYKGLKYSRKEKVLDVKTKDPILSIASIMLSAGAGADGAKQSDGKIQPRYAGYAGASFFSEMLTIEATADVNNVRDNSLSGAGIKPAAYAAIGEAHYRPSFSAYGEMAGVDVDLNKYWKDREYGNSFSAHYSLERQYDRSISESLTEYFAGDGIPAMSYEDSLSKSSVSVKHTFRSHMDLKNTKIEDIRMNVNGSVSENRSMSVSSTLNRTDGQQDRSQYRDAGSDGSDYNISAEIMWSKNDNIRFQPAISISANIYSNNSFSWDTDTLASSFTRRQLQTDGIGKGFKTYANASLRSYIVNNEKMSLSASIGYNFHYDRTRRRQMTYDFLENPVSPELYITDSYDYDWNMMTNDISLAMTMDLRKVSINLGIRGGRVTQIDDERFPGAVRLRKGYTRIEPELDIQYGMHSFSIGCSASQPSLQQTRDRMDDSNPMVLTAGNPDLKQVYATDVEFSGLIFRSGKTGMSLMYRANATYVANSIVSQSRYFTQDTHVDGYGGYDVKAGSMLYTYANASQGSLRSDISFPFSAIFRKARLLLSLIPEANFEMAPQYVGESLSTLNTTRMGLRMALKWFPKSLLVNIVPAVYRFNSDNSSGQRITSGWQMGGRFNIHYTTPIKLWIDATLSENYFKYTSEAGRDMNVLTLRGSIGRSFLKNSLMVSLSGMDLLNRGTAYTTMSTSNYFKQEWKPTYGRYFMLTLVYVFRHKN